MPAQDAAYKDLQEAQTSGENRCSARLRWKNIGLPMLGALIVIPAVCFYLSRYLIRENQVSLRRRWTSLRNSMHYSEDPNSPRSISIPTEEGSTFKTEELGFGAAPAMHSLESPKATEAQFVGSTEQDRFHISTCRWARNILETHRISFDTREDAVAKGYKPCGTCRP